MGTIVSGWASHYAPKIFQDNTVAFGKSNLIPQLMVFMNIPPYPTMDEIAFS